MLKTLDSFLFCLLLSAITCGCGGEPRPADLPPLHECIIVITMEGKPLEGASVDLHGDESSKWFAFGVTDANGRSVMKTQAKFPGAIEGDYVITVTKEGNAPDWKPDPDRPDLGAPIISFVSEKYANRTTSPLRCSVKKSANLFSFDLEPYKKK